MKAKATTHEKLLHGTTGSILALIALAFPQLVEIKTDVAVLKRQACECRHHANSPAAAMPNSLVQTNLLAKATHEQ